MAEKGDRTSMANKKATRTQHDGNNQTAFAEVEEEGATGEPPKTEKLSQVFKAFPHQQLRDVRRDCDQQTQEFQLRNREHQFGHLQQEIGGTRLLRALALTRLQQGIQLELGSWGAPTLVCPKPDSITAPLLVSSGNCQPTPPDGTTAPLLATAGKGSLQWQLVPQGFPDDQRVQASNSCSTVIGKNVVVIVFLSHRR